MDCGRFPEGALDLRSSLARSDRWLRLIHPDFSERHPICFTVPQKLTNGPLVSRSPALGAYAWEGAGTQKDQGEVRRLLKFERIFY